MSGSIPQHLAGSIEWSLTDNLQRGGEGNAYHAEGYEPKPSLMHEGLADKLKHKIFGNKRKSST